MGEEKYQKQSNGWPNEPKDLHMWLDGCGTAVHNK